MHRDMKVAWSLPKEPCKPRLTRQVNLKELEYKVDTHSAGAFMCCPKKMSSWLSMRSRPFNYSPFVQEHVKEIDSLKNKLSVYWGLLILKRVLLKLVDNCEENNSMLPALKVYVCVCIYIYIHIYSIYMCMFIYIDVQM